ncbi:MAG: S8 family serine peptidase [Ktedonobacteraceae bacterium]
MKWEEPFNAVPPAINFNYQSLPDIVEGTPPERVVTGKDIYGRHVGFPMEDHGLFIAGILRDLAPEANIECIRVLNDFGVGDICTLYDVLIKIHDRMSEGGDLHGKPVVINLSLVVLPPEDDIPEGVTEDILESTRDALYRLLQCLADQGAIFVAAAGNDSDPRMNASEKRFGPRYPAALASDQHAMPAMISVGAVNRNRQAARYSNYPGPYGIATYTGDLPKPDPWLPSAMDHVVARVDTNDIDALCGVYTAAQYPALSKNDPKSEYSVPNSDAWAYWSGTSFATPIISALAARYLQGQDPKSIDVRQAILEDAMDEVMWTTVGEDGKDIPGPMIMAEQA